MPSEQTKVLNLLSAAEIQRTAGQYDSLKKTCHLIYSLAKDCYPKNADLKRRDVFFCQLSFSLFSEIGDYLAGKGFPGEALKFYQELFNLFPEDMTIVKKIARTYYTMGPHYLPEAERYYRLALTDNPEDLEIAENLGRVLYASPGGQEEARLVYRNALLHCRTDMDKLRFYSHLSALSPDDSDIFLRMGRLYQRQGMFIEAKRCLEEAHNIHNDPWETLNLAYLYYLLNDFRKAEVLLDSLPHGDEQLSHASRYLLGLIKEGEGRLDEASALLKEVPPESAYYWKASVGLARVYLHQGNYLEAENLARRIPLEERTNLGVDFLELCEMLEDVLQRECRFKAEEWRDHISKSIPSFHLKKAVHKRSMGSKFWRKYEALEVVGRGPVGQVLLGRERRKGFKVAIKHLYQDFLVDPLVVRRLQGILQTSRYLDKYNSYVVRTYEDSFFQGSFFYAMEYMEWDLASVIKTWAPAPTKVVTEIAVQICDALTYLYSRNSDSLHGGLKPENILFSANKELKISGFDFLSALEGKRVFSVKDINKRPSFLRTFSYFAPERFSNRGFLKNLKVAFEGVDLRADLYSLGVILFELATGFLPFETQSVQALLAFHKTRTHVLPRFFNPSIHPGLEEIIVTLMAKEPSQRFSIPGEVKEAIQKFRKLYRQ